VADLGRRGRTWQSAAVLGLGFALFVVGCTSDSDSNDATGPGANTEQSRGFESATGQPHQARLSVEAVEAVGERGLLVGGRWGHSQASHVWSCQGVSMLSRCRDISPPNLKVSEYVENIAVAAHGVFWMLTIDVDQPTSFVRITGDQGDSWVLHTAPSRGLAAGSTGRIRADSIERGWLTQSWANGPVTVRYITDDRGISWQVVSRTRRARLSPGLGLRVRVPSHCGVLSAVVADQLWLAVPPLGGHNPPPGWDENSTPGLFIRLNAQRAEFIGISGQLASFSDVHPQEPTIPTITASEFLSRSDPEPSDGRGSIRTCRAAGPWPRSGRSMLPSCAQRQVSIAS